VSVPVAAVNVVLNGLEAAVVDEEPIHTVYVRMEVANLHECGWGTSKRVRGTDPCLKTGMWV
jgi:hypothetical protein